MHWNDEQKGHTENIHLIIRRSKKKISLVYMDFDLEMFSKRKKTALPLWNHTFTVNSL